MLQCGGQRTRLSDTPGEGRHINQPIHYFKSLMISRSYNENHPKASRNHLPASFYLFSSLFFSYSALTLISDRELRGYVDTYIITPLLACATINSRRLALTIVHTHAHARLSLSDQMILHIRQTATISIINYHISQKKQRVS